MVDIRLVLRDKNDELDLQAQNVEEFAALLPLLKDSSDFARFFGRSAPAAAPAVEKVEEAEEVPPLKPGKVQRVTAAQVVAAANAKKKGAAKPSSRSKDLADEDKPAGAGLLLLVEKQTGEKPADGITVGEAKALLKGGE